VKFKIENGKNYLAFIDSIDESTTKTKLYDVEDMDGIAQIVETKNIPHSKTLQKEIEEEQFVTKRIDEFENSDAKQPFNTTKCRVFKTMSLLAKADINSTKLFLLPKGVTIYVYLEWKGEYPGKFVRCIYYDNVGKEHKGYVFSSQLEWLQAG
jgi:hypothetical protein